MADKVKIEVGQIWDVQEGKSRDWRDDVITIATVRKDNHPVRDEIVRDLFTSEAYNIEFIEDLLHDLYTLRVV